MVPERASFLQSCGIFACPSGLRHRRWYLWPTPNWFCGKKLKSLSSNFKILNWFDEGCSKTTLLAGQQFGFIISVKIWLPRSFVRIESIFSKMAQLSVKPSSLVSAFGNGLWAHDRTSGEGHGDHWGRKKNLV